MGGGTMASCYIKLCEDAAENALKTFPVNEFPNEYEHAKDMYKLLLLACCCFLLRDLGKYQEICIIEKDCINHNLPFSFAPWAHLVYNNYLDYVDSDFTDRDEIDSERQCNGHCIGEYIFKEFIFDFLYNIVVKDLWDSLEYALSKIKKGDV